MFNVNLLKQANEMPKFTHVCIWGGEGGRVETLSRVIVVKSCTTFIWYNPSFWSDENVWAV